MQYNFLVSEFSREWDWNVLCSGNRILTENLYSKDIMKFHIFPFLFFLSGALSFQPYMKMHIKYLASFLARRQRYESWIARFIGLPETFSLNFLLSNSFKETESACNCT